MSQKEAARQAVRANIKKYREKMKLSQRQLSELLGVDASTVAYWETGRGSPNADMLVQLCKLFGIKPTVMMGVAEEFDSHLTEAAKLYALYTAASPEVRLAVDSLLKYKG